MHEHVETFHTKKCYKLAIVVFALTSLFSKEKFVVHFQTLFARKQGLAHPYILFIIELLQHCLSYDLRQMATFLALEVRFYQRVCLF